MSALTLPERLRFSIMAVSLSATGAARAQRSDARKATRKNRMDMIDIELRSRYVDSKDERKQDGRVAPGGCEGG